MEFLLTSSTERSMMHSALLHFQENPVGERWAASERHLNHAASLLVKLDYPNNCEGGVVGMNRLEASVLIEALNRLSSQVSYVYESERIADLIVRLREMLNNQFTK